MKERSFSIRQGIFMDGQWYPIEQRESVKKIAEELRVSGWYNIIVSLVAIVGIGLFLFKDYIFFDDWTFPIASSIFLFCIVCVLNAWGLLYGSFKIRASRTLVCGIDRERMRLFLRVMTAFSFFDLPWFSHIASDLRKIYETGASERKER